VVDRPVLVLGDALLDQVYRVEALPPRGGDAAISEFTRRPGGAGLNVATGLAALGVGCALVTTVGEDAPGRELLEHLKVAGVDRRFVSQAGVTGQVLSFADAHGERTMFSYRGAAATPPEWSADLVAALAGTPLVFVSGYGLKEPAQAERYLGCLARAKAAGGQIAFDPAPVVSQLDRAVVARVLGFTDLLLLNAAEWVALTGQAAADGAWPASLGPVGVVGLKQGARGSRVAKRDGGSVETVACPAEEVEAADTTGAGDAYDAGFLAAWLSGAGPHEWGAAGNRAAAARLVAANC
jgi:sugar/nucleoside kinase (ribokinase family)